MPTSDERREEEPGEDARPAGAEPAPRPVPPPLREPQLYRPAPPVSSAAPMPPDANPAPAAGATAPPPPPPAPGGPPPGGGWSGGWPPAGPWSGWSSVPPAPAPRASLSYGQFLGRAVTVWILGVLALAAGFFAFLLPFIAVVALLGAGAPTGPDDFDVGPTAHVAGFDGVDDVVLIVPVEGIITTDEIGGGLFGLATSGGYDIRDVLQRAARDPEVKAVVLDVNTPGGTVTGSAAIADGVELVKKAGKPVVAHVSGLAASGGMYAMAPADLIVADTGTLIGSIGVILGPFRQYTDVVAVDDGLFAGGVETTGGVIEYSITAGTGKDFGSPYRPLTDFERTTLQRGVDRAYATFVNHVAANRDISAEDIRAELGALVYDEQTSVELGLVDMVGNRDMAYEQAAELAGLISYDVREIDPLGGFFDALFGADGNDAPPPGAVSGSLTEVCGPGPRVLLFYGDLEALSATAAVAAARGGG